MYFDMPSMKLRAKSLIQETTPTPMLAGLIMILPPVLMIWLMTMIDKPIILAALAIVGLISEIIAVGFDWYCLMIAREENPTPGKVFAPFTKQQLTVILACVLKPLIFFVMFMLLYVPFFIAFYWFRPLNYIIMDNPNLNVFAAMKKSISMMKGHKLELLKLDLSLIGWHILSLITVNIAGVYIYPYTSVVYAEYYEHIKGQSNLFTGEKEQGK